MTGVKILGTGIYLPERCATNEDFTKIVDTNDEWISTRTGIKERRISQGEPTWYMGLQAARAAISESGININDINMIVDTTVTPDFFIPSTACIIQRELGIEDCLAMDLNCACSGSVYAMDMAKRYMQTDSEIKYVLIVANETLSKLTDYTDRSTCVLFGDGAAACVLEKREDTLYSASLHADGSGAKYLTAKALDVNNAFMPNEVLSFDDGMVQLNKHYIYGWQRGLQICDKCTS